MARKWRPPKVGSKARQKMPRSVFLIPSQRKYPYKVKRGNRWVATEQGLMAAYRRAILQKNAHVKNRARAKLNKLRKDKGKPPVGG